MRVLYLRLLGLVFFAAFAGALLQNQALLGSHGLAPACAAARLPPAPARSLAELWPRARAALAQPSLFWLVGCSDDSLAAVALAGAAAALVPLLLGACNIALLLVLWACQVSFVNLGSVFYAFGWETQLLETALWAGVALPLVSLSTFDAELAPSSTAFALVSRALIGKIMLGAGMIKIRGDACWRDLWHGASCMQTHYETQPSPNPLSAAFHFGFFGLSERLGLDARAVELWHGVETLTNHVVELGVPLLLLPFLPRLCRVAAGVALVGFQLVLIASCNLALLNHLTILPALFAFDDAAVAPLFSASMRGRASAAAAQADVLAADMWAALCSRQPPAKPMPRTMLAGGFYGARSALAGAALVAYAALQAPVVQNLLSARQAMNRSFGAWHLSNTYGAFGSVGKVRTEISLVGYGDDGVARAYEFPCHPGALSRRPCVIAPYHLRADWLAWFAGLEGMTYQQYPFVVHLVDELLSGKPLHRPTARDSLVGALRELMPALLATDARDVLSFDPFRGAAAPPQSVAVLLYEYRFTPPGLSRTLQRLRLPAAAPAPEIDADALGSELCAAVPAAWAWRAGACSARVRFADDGSGAYVEIASAGGVAFEVGAVWSRRQRGGPWLPALERGNPSVRAFLDAHGWRE